MSLPAAERRAKKRARQEARRGCRFGSRFGTSDYVRAMHREPCAVGGADCHGPPQCSHLRSRGAGGTWRSIVPMCQHHHHQWHALGRQSFCAQYRTSIEALQLYAGVLVSRHGHLVESQP